MYVGVVSTTETERIANIGLHKYDISLSPLYLLISISISAFSVLCSDICYRTNRLGYASDGMIYPEPKTGWRKNSPPDGYYERMKVGMLWRGYRADPSATATTPSLGPIDGGVLMYFVDGKLQGRPIFLKGSWVPCVNIFNIDHEPERVLFPRLPRDAVPPMPTARNACLYMF